MLEALEFRLLDVGASGGIDPFWRQFEPNLSAVGFDPLATEVDRLNRFETNPRVRYVAAWIGAGTADGLAEDVVPDTDFEIGQPLTAHSLTSATSGQKYADYNYEKEVFNVGQELSYAERKISIDQWLEETPNDRPDVIKCDVDGYDYDVWIGASRLLAEDAPLALISECQFQDAKNRRGASFGDIDALLRRRGYRLFTIEPYSYTRAALPGRFKYDIFAQTETGQAGFCDALYMLDPVMDRRHFHRLCLDPSALLKLVIFYQAFGLADCAAELLVLAQKNDVLLGVDIDQLLDLLTPEHPYPGIGYQAFLSGFAAAPRLMFPSARRSAALGSEPYVRDWLADMKVGTAGRRILRGIESVEAAEGFFAFGPYATLMPGRYLVSAIVRVAKAHVDDRRLLAEFVVNEHAISHRNFDLIETGAVFVNFEYTCINDAAPEVLQIRFAVSLGTKVSLTDAVVTRLE